MKGGGTLRSIKIATRRSCFTGMRICPGSADGAGGPTARESCCGSLGRLGRILQQRCHQRRRETRRPWSQRPHLPEHVVGEEAGLHQGVRIFDHPADAPGGWQLGGAGGCFVWGGGAAQRHGHHAALRGLPGAVGVKEYGGGGADGDHGGWSLSEGAGRALRGPNQRGDLQRQPRCAGFGQ